MKYWDKSITLVEGCSSISEACDHCWSKEMTHRFDENNLLTRRWEDRTEWTGKIRIREDRLDIPKKTKKPTVFAVWNDLFFPTVPAKFICEAFDMMGYCKRHTFLVLTKRPERIISVLYEEEGRYYLGGGDFLPNVWLGTTVEAQEWADIRISPLLQCDPFPLFLSIEPLLEKIKLVRWMVAADKPFPISQVIIGAESGPHRRPCKLEWVESIVEQCKMANIPVFVKQLDIGGKLIRDINQFPKHLQIRELAWRK